MVFFFAAAILPALLVQHCSARILGSHNNLKADTEPAASDSNKRRLPKVVGGAPAPTGAYPWFVDWSGCGGSLIHSDIVMTAAHCLGLDDNNAYVGAYFSQNVTGGAELKQVGSRSVHPEYRPTTWENDIMLLKLDSFSAKPTVELNTDMGFPAQGDDLVVIGHGATGSVGMSSDILLEVTVPYVTDSVCGDPAVYGSSFYPDSMLCAGDFEEGGMDSCQGDSGGPLFYDDGLGNYIQVGITSWGRGCALPGFPGIYSKVSAFAQWINEQICMLSDDRPPSCPQTVTPVRLDLLSDKYPREMSWSLTQQSTGKVVQFRRSSVYFLRETLTSERFYLEPGSYTFSISDTFKDGICCSDFSGEGEIKMYAELDGADVLLFYSDGNYTSGFSATFTVAQDDATRSQSTHVPTRSPTPPIEASPTDTPTKSPTQGAVLSTADASSTLPNNSSSEASRPSRGSTNALRRRGGFRGGTK